ncbi:hypothetical protein BDV06DRAFT_129886 [Aspergillus oleicola]
MACPTAVLYSVSNACSTQGAQTASEQAPAEVRGVKTRPINAMIFQFVSFSAVRWSFLGMLKPGGGCCCWAMGLVCRWNQFHRAWTTYGTRLNTIVRLAWDFLPLLVWLSEHYRLVLLLYIDRRRV